MAAFDLFSTYIIYFPEVSLQDLTNNVSQFCSLFDCKKIMYDSIMQLNNQHHLNLSTEQINQLSPGFQDINSSVRRAKNIYRSIGLIRTIAQNLPPGIDKDNLTALANERARDYVNQMEGTHNQVSSVLQQIRSLHGIE